MSSRALIIPAAGSGSRMQRDLPKPFIKLGSQPILAHTIERFLSLEGLGQIIIATSSACLHRTEKILQQTVGGRCAWQCVAGGDERQGSIYNALQEVGDCELVLVHDAVRPFVQLSHIEDCCREAAETGAAVLGFPSKNTIKKVDADRYIKETPDRDFLWQIQTPQVFKTELLKAAYEQARADAFLGTDDASLVERLGKPVRAVKGDVNNIKITYPQDLELARILLNKQEG